MPDRRHFISGSLIAAAAAPLPAFAAACSGPLDRAAFDRYLTLYNGEDQRFLDYYADDVEFMMGIKGKAGVLASYLKQREYVKATVELKFFCSDAGGAAAEFVGTTRCFKDCPDPSLFGQPVKAGQMQVMHSYMFYALNSQGKVASIKATMPDILHPWGPPPA